MSRQTMAKKKKRALRNKKLRLYTEALRRTTQADVERRWMLELERRAELQAAASPEAQIKEFHANCQSLKLGTERVRTIFDEVFKAGKQMLADEDHKFDKLDLSKLYVFEEKIITLEEHAKKFLVVSGQVANFKDDYASAMGVIANEVGQLAADITSIATIALGINEFYDCLKKIYANPEKIEELMAGSMFEEEVIEDAHEVVEPVTAPEPSPTKDTPIEPEVIDQTTQP